MCACTCTVCVRDITTKWLEIQPRSGHISYIVGEGVGGTTGAHTFNCESHIVQPSVGYPRTWPEELACPDSWYLSSTQVSLLLNVELKQHLTVKTHSLSQYWVTLVCKHKVVSQ